MERRMTSALLQAVLQAEQSGAGAKLSASHLLFNLRASKLGAEVTE